MKKRIIHIYTFLLLSFSIQAQTCLQDAILQIYPELSTCGFFTLVDVPTGSTLTQADLDTGPTCTNFGDTYFNNPCVDFDNLECGHYPISYTALSETCEGVECRKTVTYTFVKECEGTGGTDNCKLSCDVVGSEISICQGQTMDLYISGVAGSGDYDIDWTGPTGNGNGTGTTLIIEDATGGVYDIKIEDNVDGCCSSCSFTVIEETPDYDIGVNIECIKPKPEWEWD